MKSKTVRFAVNNLDTYHTANELHHNHHPVATSTPVSAQSPYPVHYHLDIPKYNTVHGSIHSLQACKPGIGESANLGRGKATTGVPASILKGKLWSHDRIFRYVQKRGFLLQPSRRPKAPSSSYFAKEQLQNCRCWPRHRPRITQAS